ncbi:MAG: DUF1761 domain-containing protein [Lewinellaceae bacterium]|nr:DUF1761 domain-containing protein [Lewinella sp.]MCB9281779.1 DUF1761 domain-containing protein [Lewinellaceae bacterium]
MESGNLNHLAVIAAALSTFVLGALWFSPILFGKAWMVENNLTEEDLKKGSMAKILGLALIFALVMAYNLGFFLADPSVDFKMGALYGFLTGFGWVAMAIFTIGLFERKTWRYMLINAGYMIVSFTVMGMILGAWK